MDFDELLQRDLDDHRVATELIPYLLRDPKRGPVFFPPVLAVLLPYEGMGQTNFPAPDEDTVNDNSLSFRRKTFGEAFEVRKLAEPETGDLSDIRFCRLGWNEERAKLVVIDGQHRAMALLAIDRTLNGTWEDDVRGARYRHFYERRVESVLATYPEDQLEMVHVPVTVCWFPDLVADNGPPHTAARRLFVDVNREARPPSEDRLVLLSDDDLLNILTRSLLNSLRVSEDDPPLYAVEYDSPSTGGRPGRWSTMLSLQSIRNVIRRTVFGPKKYVVSVTTRMRGRTSAADEDSWMRGQLRVRELFKHDLRDFGGGRREELGRTAFPKATLAPLISEFETGWGEGLLILLGELTPFRAHYGALRELNQEWTPADPATVDALAREAIFEGVGMFWTLRDSYEHWRATTAASERTNKPEVVQAWERMLEKEDQFRRLRAKRLIGGDEEEKVRLSDSVYDVFQTQACQVSLGLTLATLAAKAGLNGVAIPELAQRLVEALNTSMDAVGSGEMSRRLMLSKSVEQSLNQIADMNTTRAIEFRYFWLELLCDESVVDEFVAHYESLTTEVLRELRDHSRMRYGQQLIEERVRSMRRLEKKSREQLLPRATVEVMAVIEGALGTWFDIPASEVREWAASADLLGDDEDESDG